MTDGMKSFDAESDFRRYLEAKTTVDDRALDVGTMMALADALAERGISHFAYWRWAVVLETCSRVC